MSAINRHRWACPSGAMIEIYRRLTRITKITKTTKEGREQRHRWACASGAMIEIYRQITKITKVTPKGPAGERGKGPFSVQYYSAKRRPRGTRVPNPQFAIDSAPGNQAPECPFLNQAIILISPLTGRSSVVR